MAGIIDVGFKTQVIGQQELDNLLKKVKELNKKTDIKIDLGKSNEIQKTKQLVDQYGNAIKSTNTEVKKLNETKKESVKVNKEVSTSSNQINNSLKSNEKSINNLTSAYIALAHARKLMYNITEDIKKLAIIDDSMYNLGVVAGKTSNEIEMMKWEFLDTATKTTQSAKELADATDILARSGLEYKSALQTMEAGARLATASGESVADTSRILSKALVAFKLDGQSAQEAVDSFFSTVLKTPLSLEGLSSGLKNSASAMSSFITFTSKGSDELTKYKEDLLELNTALIGSSVSMGLNASQAGTMLRSSLSRLITNEKTAIKLFDNLNLVGKDGIITFEKFSKIASNDVFEALDILAKNFDKLDKATLKALFTQRQFVRIVPILSEISDYTDGAESATRLWMKSYTDGQKVVDGFNTQLDNFNNQLKIFSNNIDNAKEASFDLIKTLGMDFLPIANNILTWLSDFENGSKKIIIQVAAISSSVMVLSGALKALLSISAVQSGVGLMLSPIGLTIGAISGVAALLYLSLKKIQKINKELNFNKHVEEFKKLNSEQEITLKNTEKYKKVLDRIEEVDITSEWQDTINILDKAISKSKEFNSLQEQLNTLLSITKGTFNEVKIPNETIVGLGILSQNLEKTTLRLLDFKGFDMDARGLATQKKYLEDYEDNIIRIQKEINSLEEEVRQSRASTPGALNDSERTKNLKERLGLLKEENNLLTSYIGANSSLLQKKQEINKIEEANLKAQLDFFESFSKSGGEFDRLFSTIEEGVISDVLKQPVKDFKEWKSLMEDMNQYSVLKLLNNFEGIVDQNEKLNLVTSSLFKKYAPTLKFFDDLLETAEEGINQNNEYSDEWEKVSKRIKNAKENIVKAVINQKELNDTSTYTVRMYSEINDKLIEQERLFKLIGLSGKKLLEQKKSNLKEDLNSIGNLEDLNSELENRKKLLDDILIQGKKEGEEYTFTKKELEDSYKIRLKDYEETKNKLAERQKILNNISTIEENISKYDKDQVDTIKEYISEINKLSSKEMTLDDIRATGLATRENINKEIDKQNRMLSEELILKSYGKDISDDEIDSIEKRIDGLQTLLKWLGMIEDENEKIAKKQKEDEVNINQYRIERNNIGKSNSEVMQSDYKRLKESLLLTDDEVEKERILTELAKLEYNIEQDKLKLQIQRNSEMLKTVNMATDLIDKISGTDFASIVAPLTQLFEQNKDGQNMFSQFGGMFGKSGTGISTQGVQAGLGIAGIGFSVAQGIAGYMDAKDQKRAAEEEARFQKQFSIMKDQLEALKSLSSGIDSITNEMITTLTELPSSLNKAMIESQAEIIRNAVQQVQPDLSFGFQYGSKKNRESGTIDLKNLFSGGDIGIGGYDGLDGMINATKELGLQVAILEDYKAKGYEINDNMDMLNYIINTTTEDFGKLGDIYEGGTKESWETLQESAQQYKDILVSIGILTKDEMEMRAKYAGFSLVDYKSASEQESYYREMLAAIEESDPELFNDTINSLMEGYQEVSSKSAKLLRDGIVSGITEGKTQSEAVISSMSDMFKSLSNDINQTLLDIQFAPLYDTITELTTAFYDSFTGSESISEITDMTQQFSDNMATALKPLLDNEGQFIDTTTMLANSLLDVGVNLGSVLDNTGVTMESLGMTYADMLRAWKNGEITWEQLNAEAGSYLDYQKQIRQNAMSELEIAENNKKEEEDKLKVLELQGASQEEIYAQKSIILGIDEQISEINKTISDNLDDAVKNSKELAAGELELLSNKKEGLKLDAEKLGIDTDNLKVEKLRIEYALKKEDLSATEKEDLTAKLNIITAMESTENDISAIYTQRKADYAEMSNNIFDQEMSLREMYDTWKGINDSELKSKENSLATLKTKQEATGLDADSAKALYDTIMATDELLGLNLDINNISDEQYATLLETSDITEGQIQNLIDYLGIDMEIADVEAWILEYQTQQSERKAEAIRQLGLIGASTRQIMESDLAILEAELLIAETEADIAEINTKIAKQKYDIAVYEEENRQKINQLYMREYEITQDNLRTAFEKYKVDRDDLGLKYELLNIEKQINDYSDDAVFNYDLIGKSEEEILSIKKAKIEADIMSLAIQQDITAENAKQAAIQARSLIDQENKLQADIKEALASSSLPTELRESLSNRLIDSEIIESDLTQILTWYTALSELSDTTSKANDEIDRFNISLQEQSELLSELEQLQGIYNDSLVDYISTIDLDENDKIIYELTKYKALLQELEGISPDSTIDFSDDMNTLYQNILNARNALDDFVVSNKGYKDEAGEWVFESEKLNKEYDELVNSYEMSEELIQRILEAQGDLTEEVGNTTDSLRDGLLQAFKDSFKTENFTEQFNTISSYLGESFTDNIIDNLLDQQFQSEFLRINSMMQDMISNNISFSGVNEIRNEVARFSAQAQQERLKLSALQSMLNIDQDYTYTDDRNAIEYQTSSTQQNTYNYNTQNIFDIGTVVSTRAEMQAFASAIAPYITKAQGEGK